MKILYIVNSDLGKHGTIGIRTFNVAREAYHKKILGEIICRGDFQKDISKTYIKKVFPLYRIFNLGLSFICQHITNKFPARDIQLKLFDWIVARKMRKSKVKFDILHTYEYAPKCMAVAKEKGMKIVMDTQMAHTKTANHIFNRNLSYDILTTCSNLADKIIASSEFVVISFTGAGVNQEKMELIPHGVSLEKFDFKGQNKEKDKFICLFVGIIEPRKGVEYLLKAWTELKIPHSKLILCGLINQTMIAEVRRYSSDPTIEFKGFTDPTPFYKNANVFVFPSIFESSAKVLYEAMASSLPVITTFNSGPIFKDGEAGFIVPIKDEEAIKEKINYLYHHPEEAKQMGVRGKKIVSNHSWDSYGKRVVKVYENLFE